MAHTQKKVLRKINRKLTIQDKINQSASRKKPKLEDGLVKVKHYLDSLIDELENKIIFF